MAKFCAPFPPTQLQKKRLYNNADTLADIVATLAGNAALYNGAIYGGDFVDAGGECANQWPAAPGGTGLGHDHSGGLFGRPLYRSVATFHYPPGWVMNWPSVAPNTEDEEALGGALPFWLPHGDPGEYGAYSTLEWKMRLNIDVSTNTHANDDLDISVAVLGLEGSRQTTTLDPITSTGERWLSSSDVFKARPGDVNVLNVSARLIADGAGGSNRTVRVSVYDIEIGVRSSY